MECELFNFATYVCICTWSCLVISLFEASPPTVKSHGYWPLQMHTDTRRWLQSLLGARFWHQVLRCLDTQVILFLHIAQLSLGVAALEAEKYGPVTPAQEMLHHSATRVLDR